jgi:hypothetical protein
MFPLATEGIYPQALNCTDGVVALTHGWGIYMDDIKVCFRLSCLS